MATMPPAGQPPRYPGPTPVPRFTVPPAALAGPPYGGFWIRAVATIIDGAMVGVVSAAVFVVLARAANIICPPVDLVTGTVPNCTVDTPALVIAAYVAMVAIPVLYFAITWGRGRTVGQKIFGMRVVDAETGQEIGTARGLIRVIGSVAASFAFCIGLMWVGWDARKQGWHDKIAATVVLLGRP